MRTSTLIERLEPIGSISLSCRARSSLTCMSSGSSPTSSRNRVPPLASWNLPRCLSVAPVKLPFSWPNRIDSTRFSGMAPQKVDVRIVSTATARRQAGSAGLPPGRRAHPRGRHDIPAWSRRSTAQRRGETSSAAGLPASPAGPAGVLILAVADALSAASRSRLRSPTVSRDLPAVLQAPRRHGPAPRQFARAHSRRSAADPGGCISLPACRSGRLAPRPRRSSEHHRQKPRRAFLPSPHLPAHPGESRDPSSPAGRTLANGTAPSPGGLGLGPGFRPG